MDIYKYLLAFHNEIEIIIENIYGFLSAAKLIYWTNLLII